MERITGIYTAGEPDSGKSTLVGRLLFESGCLKSDQIDAISRPGGEIDLHLVTDGLEAEAARSMTIDTAYRHLLVGKKRYLIADTPGQHELVQNAVTGGSTADIVLLTAAADQPVTPDVLKHLFAAAWLGVPRIIACITRLDTVAYSEERFRRCAVALQEAAARFGANIAAAVPVSAATGANVVRRSAAMQWHSGGTLLEEIAAAPAPAVDAGPLRIPVQVVYRTGGATWAAGEISSGTFNLGQNLASSQRTFTPEQLLKAGRNHSEAACGDPVALKLPADAPLSRGGLLFDPHSPPRFASTFRASLCWFGERELAPAAVFIARHGTSLVPVEIKAVIDAVDCAAFLSTKADKLAPRSFGQVELQAAGALWYDGEQGSASHRLVLIDPQTRETVGAGKLLGEIESG